MKIKTSELEGAALDWAVAAVTGVHDDGEHAAMEIGLGRYSPSTDWGQGGPLIDEWRVMVEPLTRLDHPEAGWHAGFKHKTGVMHGPTALIAAMRAIVASELGATVDVPEEILS